VSGVVVKCRIVPTTEDTIPTQCPSC
jgi:hypothetical protein